MKPPRKRRYFERITARAVREDGCKKLCYPSKAKAMKAKKGMSGRLIQTNAYLCALHDGQVWHLTSQSREWIRGYDALKENNDE